LALKLQRREEWEVIGVSSKDYSLQSPNVCKYKKIFTARVYTVHASVLWPVSVS